MNHKEELIAKVMTGLSTLTVLDWAELINLALPPLILILTFCYWFFKNFILIHDFFRHLFGVKTRQSDMNENERRRKSDESDI